jgi:hypothetical protein
MGQKIQWAVCRWLDLDGWFHRIAAIGAYAMYKFSFKNANHFA